MELLACIPPNRVVRTRNRVTKSPVRPGIASGGIRKLIHDTMTIPKDGK